MFTAKHKLSVNLNSLKLLYLGNILLSINTGVN